jgi:hypothetical protein
MPNRLNLDGAFFRLNVIEDSKAVHPQLPLCQPVRPQSLVVPCFAVGPSRRSFRASSANASSRTGSDMFLALAVPGGRVQLGEPRPKCGEFLRGKPANSILDLFKGAHKTKPTPPDKSAQPGVFLTADETPVNFPLDRFGPTCYKITVRLRRSDVRTGEAGSGDRMNTKARNVTWNQRNRRNQLLRGLLLSQEQLRGPLWVVRGRCQTATYRVGVAGQNGERKANPNGLTHFLSD